MTALQELMSFIENQRYNFLNKEQIESCTNIQNKANELLEKEKQQIIDANEYGTIHYENGEQYYEQTFNQPKQ
jgi:hypothetical protein